MFEAKVEAFLARHSLKLDHINMVVGVSGGPDSLALLHFLQKEREKKDLNLVVAHVDHMFRGQESYEDAMFVKNYCQSFDIPFEMTRVNVPELIHKTGKSSQVAAREVRYEFYHTVMEKYKAPYLALGHHGDDQVETILMRLTRGSTGMARAGIPFSRPFGTGMIIRPFLCVTKREIQLYCQENHLIPRLDPSNDKGIYSRNRFRKEVLPFLKKENPQVHEHFQRFSEELQTDDEFLNDLASKEIKAAVKEQTADKMSIDISKFLEMPLPLQRRAIQLILKYLYKEEKVTLSAIHIDQIFRLLQRDEPSGTLDFPHGLKVIQSYQQLSFHFNPDKAKPYYIEAREPGNFLLPNGDSVIIEKVNRDISERGSHIAVFNEEEIKWPIVIRTRSKGDRMTLKGMSGSKKLKDIFIDEKIPLHDRDTWPVITDGHNRIIWLPGLKRSSFEEKKAITHQNLLLTLKSNDLLGGTMNDESGH
ncbi:tRNA lysidine(34) synthetase TilS [Bacillus sp. JJ1764]|uniref:tRNA lysidine(34) synthetase TilS n=1 Tax=Bacillus sp. JJ1764 TaxID=3122964 RepID=UPI00300046AA